jgi:head-tail adaptor
MRAGDLNRKITVKRRAQIGTSSTNEPTFEWQTFKTVAANAKFLRAGERLESGQKFAAKAMVFKTRWMALEPTDIIVFDGSNFDITGIAEIGRRVGLEITAEWRQGVLE